MRSGGSQDRVVCSLAKVSKRRGVMYRVEGADSVGGECRRACTGRLT